MLFRLLIAFLIVVLRSPPAYQLLTDTDNVIIAGSDTTVSEIDVSEEADEEFSGLDANGELIIELDEDMSYGIH